MTDQMMLTAKDTLVQAIAVLKDLRDTSGAYREILGGDFQTIQFLDGPSTQLGTVTVQFWDGSRQTPDGSWDDSPAITLMRALHSTVDPQIALLEAALVDYSSWYGEIGWEDGDGDPEPYFTRSLSIAHAIIDGSR